jgi:hypothetical protein
MLNPNLIKEIPSNPAHQDLSNNTKGTIQFLWNFQQRFILIFSEEIIQYLRTFTPQVQTPWNPADAPLLLESFLNWPRMRSEASQFRGSDSLQNERNKLPSFIDRSNLFNHNKLGNNFCWNYKRECFKHSNRKISWSKSCVFSSNSWCCSL